MKPPVKSSRVKAAAAALPPYSDEVAAIFALSNDGFVAVDAQHVVKYVSSAFELLTGLSSAQVRCQPLDLLWGLLSQQCSHDVAQAGVAGVRSHLADPDSQRRSVLTLLRPVPRKLKVSQQAGPGGGIASMLCFRDVTHELAVDRRKTGFLSNAAHELRAPLASIAGYAEAMQTRLGDTATQADFAGIISQQAQMMGNLIDEMLGLSRIDARRQSDLLLERVSAHDLVSAALVAFKLEPGYPPPQIACPKRPLYIRVDNPKAQQVLLNVLSNAYKYSAHGSSVQIGIESAQTDSAMPEVAIHIRDNGIGMTAAQLARLFERFDRINAATRMVGTGLGMSIAKELMQLLGGRVDVQSIVGAGTCVSLFFPAAG